MKFPASVLLVLLLVPVESALWNSDGYYFDGKGGAIGAGAGAALGLLGFAFQSKKILHERSLISEEKDNSSPTSGSEVAQKELSLQPARATSGERGNSAPRE